MKKGRIVTIGGGTGHFVVLSGLKKYNCELYAIVSMADDGGSTGRLRDEYGVLPPGDIRQCLVALSNSNEAKILRELFNYRFPGGGLGGHNFGNLFLTALEKVSGSFGGAIENACKLLKIKDYVIPVTFTSATLCAELEDGVIIKKEKNIDEPKHDGYKLIKRVFFEPKVEANQSAIDAIKKADKIIIGPGDLFTSVIPNLIVEGVSKAINASCAKKIFICNIMTKFGQTNNFTTTDHFRAIARYVNPEYFIVNTSRPPSGILDLYNEEKGFFVEDDFSLNDARAIKGDFLDSAVIERKQGDKVRRSLVRHDPDKLARAIIEL